MKYFFEEVFDHNVLFEFSRCVEKFIPKCGNITIAYHKGSIIFFANLDSAFVVHVLDSSIYNNADFSITVDSSKFNSVIKNFYDGKVNIKIAEKEVVLEEGNISSKLPTKVYSIPDYLELHNFSKFDSNTTSWICDSVNRCVSSISVYPRFNGVLVDDSGGFCRICRFNSSAIRIISGDKIGLNRRMVVPNLMATFISDMKNVIDQILYNESKIGVFTKAGTLVYVSLIYDEFPNKYLDGLGLLDLLTPIESSKYYVYKFEPSVFSNVIKTISSIIGSEEPFLRWQLIGTESGTNNPVWKFYSKSLSGYETSEVLTSIYNGNCEPSIEFATNRQISGTIINSFGNEVYIYNNSDLPLVISNSEGKDVSILLKASL